METTASTSDVIVLDTRSAMQRITLLVARGWTRHIGGTVPIDRAARMVTKFRERYGIAVPVYHDCARHARGWARGRLILCPDGQLSAGTIRWVMVVTADGAGPITELEDLYDARDPRHRIIVHGYELVRVPRRKHAPAWTWRWPPHVHRDMMTTGCQLARHRLPRQAQKMIDWSRSWPGFRGLRVQRVELWRAMARARGRRQPPLTFPARTPWVIMREPSGWSFLNLQRTQPHV